MLQDSFGLSDSKFKVEFRQVDDVDTNGQKQTVAFITPSTGTANAREAPTTKGSPSLPTPPTNSVEKVESQINAGESSPRLQVLQPPQPVFDPELVKDFLSGEYCLNGVKILFKKIGLVVSY